MFHEYFFETSSKNPEQENKLFSPVYSSAVCKDPFSENSQFYVSVGLGSNVKEEDLKRPDMDIVVVLE